MSGTIFMGMTMKRMPLADQVEAGGEDNFRGRNYR